MIAAPVAPLPPTADATDMAIDGAPASPAPAAAPSALPPSASAGATPPAAKPEVYHGVPVANAMSVERLFSKQPFFAERNLLCRVKTDSGAMLCFPLLRAGLPLVPDVCDTDTAGTVLFKKLCCSWRFYQMAAVAYADGEPVVAPFDLSKPAVAKLLSAYGTFVKDVTVLLARLRYGSVTLPAAAEGAHAWMAGFSQFHLPLLAQAKSPSPVRANKRPAADLHDDPLEESDQPARAVRVSDPPAKEEKEKDAADPIEDAVIECDPSPAAAAAAVPADASTGSSSSSSSAAAPAVVPSSSAADTPARPTANDATLYRKTDQITIFQHANPVPLQQQNDDGVSPSSPAYEGWECVPELPALATRAVGDEFDEVPELCDNPSYVPAATLRCMRDRVPSPGIVLDIYDLLTLGRHAPNGECVLSALALAPLVFFEACIELGNCEDYAWMRSDRYELTWKTMNALVANVREVREHRAAKTPLLVPIFAPHTFNNLSDAVSTLVTERSAGKKVFYDELYAVGASCTCLMTLSNAITSFYPCPAHKDVKPTISYACCRVQRAALKNVLRFAPAPPTVQEILADAMFNERLYDRATAYAYKRILLDYCNIESTLYTIATSKNKRVYAARREMVSLFDEIKSLTEYITRTREHAYCNPSAVLLAALDIGTIKPSSHHDLRDAVHVNPECVGRIKSTLQCHRNATGPVFYHISNAQSFAVAACGCFFLDCHAPESEQCYVPCFRHACSEARPVIWRVPLRVFREIWTNFETAQSFMH